jgi:hypothetical protein
MQKFLSLVFCAAAAAAFTLPALPSGEGARPQASANASAEQPAKPARKLRVPAQRKDPEARASASAGSSAQDEASRGTDLGVQADKEDEERRKEERMQRRK